MRKLSETLRRDFPKGKQRGWAGKEGIGIFSYQMPLGKTFSVFGQKYREIPGTRVLFRPIRAQCAPFKGTFRVIAGLTERP